MQFEKRSFGNGEQAPVGMHRKRFQAAVFRKIFSIGDHFRAAFGGVGRRILDNSVALFKGHADRAVRHQNQSFGVYGQFSIVGCGQIIEIADPAGFNAA